MSAKATQSADIELTLDVGTRTVVERYNSHAIQSVSVREDGNLTVVFADGEGPADEQIVHGYKRL